MSSRVESFVNITALNESVVIVSGGTKKTHIIACRLSATTATATETAAGVEHRA